MHSAPHGTIPESWDLQGDIRHAERDYKDPLEWQCGGADARCLWKGLQAATTYKERRCLTSR